ncbi:YqcC family protein [Neptuniibacter sp. CAU 1671]|uniref:YqcC family protein n=1 Tax=Neptuniibacter sp. CAU 1671 TaxID=3032593 RepID=UPI0023DC12C3|nr:YqcC family protein [Neptuniibacter sp. CAU 1671]MDF2182135.1 YqcC family protein [Neptuniibacter sp. CAU 1671]
MQAVTTLLLDIEVELRRLELWEALPPSDEALSSTQPFAIDTLQFNQWLQWIMIPRLHWMVQQEHCLPSNCEISPYAEEAFKQLTEDTDNLLQLIMQLDTTLNRSH